MTRSELITVLVKKYSGVLDKKRASLVLDVIFGTITDGLSESKNVELRYFGVFYNKNYKSKTMVNPKTGAKIVLGERKIPSFRASKNLKSIINNTIAVNEPINNKN